MSADNGVYILKTDKQYRVAHLHCINSLYWDCKNMRYCDDMQPEQVIKMFGKCKYTYSAEKAFDIAWSIKESLGTCEYGVVLLNAKKSWKEIIGG